MVLYTIGHSTHLVEVFLGLLERNEIRTLIDVRSFPSSRRWPQFNQHELEVSVQERGVCYQWCKALGGRRRSLLRDSPHIAWQHSAFRSYADYADTTEFARGIGSLSQLAASGTSAVMCSEGLWWRCHRRIIADYMTVRGWDVRHIMPSGKLTMHSLPDFARVCHTRIIYDGRGT